MEFNIMSSSDWTLTIIFVMLVIILIYPSVAVVTSGLTIENLFSSVIGSEQNEFINYHIKRSTLTLIIHSLLFFIYYIYICYFSKTIRFLIFQSLFWKYYFQFSIIVPVFVCSLGFYWYMGNWKKHPIARNISRACGAETGGDWRSTSMIIDQEMRSIDKFVSGIMPSKKIIITSTWIVQTELYSVGVAHQARCQLAVEQCSIYPISISRNGDDDVIGNIADSSYGAQYLKIAVSDIQDKSIYFHFRVNSNEYEDIKGRINAPLKHAKGIIIHQTLGEEFAAAFTKQAVKNPIPANIGMPTNYLPETCIGCSQIPANVKLVKTCPSESVSSESACGSCFCRPMWCVECMGRWFASRQLIAKKDPSVWMSQKASCPTCRSIFCVLDVVVLQN